MGNYREIEGNLISLVKQGEFDVITHGCNCFCSQNAGIANAIRESFNTDKFKLEGKSFYSDINKLGQIDYEVVDRQSGVILNSFEHLLEQDLEAINNFLIVVNSYTQYNAGANLDYSALNLCLTKINQQFKGYKIGIPYVIGCGIAGGNEKIVLAMIKNRLKDMDVTLVKLIK